MIIIEQGLTEEEKIKYKLSTPSAVEYIAIKKAYENKLHDSFKKYVDCHFINIVKNDVVIHIVFNYGVDEKLSKSIIETIQNLYQTELNNMYSDYNKV